MTKSESKDNPFAWYAGILYTGYQPFDKQNGRGQALNTLARCVLDYAKWTV